MTEYPYGIEQLDPPLEITLFLDRLHQAGQQIVPGSLIWLPHPEKPGRLVAGVQIKPMERKER